MFAGEPSGDLHAAAVLGRLKARRPDLHAFGFGGPKMAEAGFELNEDLASEAIMGIFPVIAAAPKLIRVYRTALRLFRERRPKLAVFVDYPGLNMRLAAAAKEMGIRTVGYIAPQVWAWGPWRTRRVARVYDELLTILPFEARHFASAGLPTRFTGHPMTDHVASRSPDAPFIAELRRGAAGPLIGVFPGSRPHVIRSLAPVLAGALRRLEGVSGIRPPRIVVGLADDRHVAAARDAFGAFPDVRIVAGKTTDVIRASDVCLATSGTVTLEIATVGKPFVIAYRVSPPVHLLGRLLVTVPHVGLVNLVAGRSVVPEHVGSFGLEAGVARDLSDLLTKDDIRSNQLEGLRRVREELHAPGAYDRTADAILDALPG